MATVSSGRRTGYVGPVTTSILVTGATGFIGRRLVPALLAEGRDVRAMTRRPEAYDGPGTAVGGDVHDPSTLGPALEGSTSRTTWCTRSTPRTSRTATPGPRRRSARRPRTPACARSSTSVGSGPRAATCPRTCARGARSRDCSVAAGCPVTVLRAGIVVGRGGISWELTRQLVKNLPAMVVPKWVATRTQPIAVDDVIRYLVGVADEPRARDRVFEIGGPEQMTYLEMLRGRVRGLARTAGPDRAGPGADATAVFVLARAGHRRRRHDRPQPDRLHGHRGGRHRLTRSGRSSPVEPVPYAEAVRRALEDTDGSR